MQRCSSMQIDRLFNVESVAEGVSVGRSGWSPARMTSQDAVSDSEIADAQIVRIILFDCDFRQLNTLGSVRVDLVSLRSGPARPPLRPGVEGGRCGRIEHLLVKVRCDSFCVALDLELWTS